MNIKIFVTFFQKYTDIKDIFKNQLYIPIFGGKTLYTGNNQILLNMQGDNEGINISQYNPWLNDFTTIYYIGKNLNKFKNIDYIGTAHYRRILEFNLDELDKNTIIQNIDDMHGLTIMQQFLFCHNNLKDKFEIVKNKYFELLSDTDKLLFDEFLNSKVIYSRNIFIMHKDLFQEYFKELEKIINLILPLINKENKNRDYGFILERFNGFIIYMLEHNYNKKIITKKFKEV